MCNNIKTSIVAGIVLYNPVMERLQENIQAIKDQVDKLVLVDNGSMRQEYAQWNENDNRIVIIRHAENMGIAVALNDILQYAYNNGYQWALTLDQDSVALPGMVAKMSLYAKAEIGIVCPLIKDRNFFHSSQEMDGGAKELDYCITSASLTNVTAWKKVGGFDNKMFIDWVDWDICIAMRKAGYKIIQTGDAVLLHELGTKAKCTHLLGHEILLLHRSPFRYYYVIRNRVYLGRKYPSEGYCKQIWIAIKSILKVVLFEKNKKNNIVAMAKGLKDGLLMDVHIVDNTK